ncbi:hypothetical protein BaRGS_00027155 [Batillaria attramentaria]|uniref:Uncharacterized protein n=1 Tax=Batillaria attramentaria TaxID=370345 RepID=A0ABD0K308_9CAEN
MENPRTVSPRPKTRTIADNHAETNQNNSNVDDNPMFSDTKSGSHTPNNPHTTDDETETNHNNSNVDSDAKLMSSSPKSESGCSPIKTPTIGANTEMNENNSNVDAELTSTDDKVGSRKALSDKDAADTFTPSRVPLLESTQTSDEETVGSAAPSSLQPRLDLLRQKVEDELNTKPAMPASDAKYRQVVALIRSGLDQGLEERQRELMEKLEHAVGEGDTSSPDVTQMRIGPTPKQIIACGLICYSLVLKAVYFLVLFHAPGISDPASARIQNDEFSSFRPVTFSVLPHVDSELGTDLNDSVWLLQLHRTSSVRECLISENTT